MSDCEQIAHDIWATVTKKYNFSQKKFEQIARFFQQIAYLFCCSRKGAICSKNLTKIVFFGTFLNIFCKLKKPSDLLIPSLLMSNVSKSLRSLTKTERCEQIAQVDHQIWANERIARFFEQIAHYSLIFCHKRVNS